MATFTTVAQLRDGSTLALQPSDRIWFNGTFWGVPVIVGSYQDSTHISDSNDIQRDISVPVHNTRYLTSSAVSLDGGASTSLSGLTPSQAPLKFTFTNASSVATSAASFYAYDNVSDVNPMPGMTFQAAEIGNDHWTAANGSGSELALANQTTNTSHDFYICLSASPTTTSNFSGAVKLVLSFS